MKITDRWKKLDTALQKACGEGLRPKPTKKEGAASTLEKKSRLKLPAEVRETFEAFASLGHAGLSWLPADATWLNAKQALQQWQSERDFDGDESDTLCCGKRVWHRAWDPARVPLAYAELATAGIYCDLRPGPKGKVGQLIFNVDEADWCVLADDLDDFLARYVAALSSGALKVEADPEDDARHVVCATKGRWGNDVWEALAIAT